ncbi:OsmC family protein [Streptomyces sp. WMMB 322]|uniref:OsmC family protein n=1 Tax=Streptomyces sp. WMMB 322 TaxID=1286821 RepID=UPI0006E16B11|nr:OsmC family protein [Streptomyces sp. WMMB 322]SCK29466.1 Uncharacterized OsmC-related protein [Streptomyces sp. WMMB 322]
MASAQAPASIVNGVDTERLKATIEAIDTDVTCADFQFRASNEWLDGAHNRSALASFRSAGAEDNTRKQTFTFDAGEPLPLLGHDEGPNPTEALLHALAACLTTSLVYHAAAKGINVRRVESSLEGDLDLRGFLGMDEDIRNGYEGIRVNMKIDCDGGEEQVRQLVETAQRRSPVFDIVTNKVPVTVSGTM